MGTPLVGTRHCAQKSDLHFAHGNACTSCTHAPSHKHTPHSQSVFALYTLSQLFMALVRTNQYKRQQQFGLAMYKKFGNSVHYYWAVMSCVMQADAASTASGAGGQPAGAGPAMFLTMADRMLRKAVTDGILTGPEHLRLYLLVMELRCDWEVSTIHQHHCTTRLFSLRQQCSRYILRSCLTLNGFEISSYTTGFCCVIHLLRGFSGPLHTKRNEYAEVLRGCTFSHALLCPKSSLPRDISE